MDFMTPPMFDVSNIDVWKIKMSMYLKTIGLHVFLAATKKSYLGNSKYIDCLLYTSPSPRDRQKSRMPSSA